MRRPPIVCCRAVQSLQPTAPQHIWISDELLSSTLHRFFRNSSPHQKRHGSHVPGPLEARRRAAKRRMTVSANFYPQDSFPSSFNLGALFGFRSSPQPSWRYEPPSLQTEPEQVAIRTYESFGHGCSMLIAVALNDIASIHVSSQPITPPGSPSPSTRAAAYSFSPNITLVRKEQPIVDHSGSSGVIGADSIAEGISRLNVTDTTVSFQAFTARIAGARGFPQERDQMLLQAYQECRPTAEDWAYNVMVMRHLLQLQWNPKVILEQHAATSFSVPPIHCPEALDLLVCLDQLASKAPHCDLEIHQLYIKLAKKASSAARSTPYQDNVLFMLVRQLWQSAHSQCVGLDSSVLALLSSVAKKFRNRLCNKTLVSIFGDAARMEHRITNLVARIAKEPELLADGSRTLSCVPQEHLREWIPSITLSYAKGASHKDGAEIAKSTDRMHIWMQLLCHLDAEPSISGGSLVDVAMTELDKFTFAYCNSGKNTKPWGRAVPARMPALLSALVVKVFQSGKFEDVPISGLSDLLRTFSTAVEQSRSTSVSASLGILFSQLQARNLPHDTLTASIIDIFIRYGAVEETRTILRVLERRRLPLVDATQVYRMVAHRVAPARGELSSKTEVFRQHLAYHLRVCQDIVEIVSRICPLSEQSQPDLLNSLQAQREFEHILNRARADNALPLVYRNASALISIQDRVALIHQLAHQYTTSDTLSQREAWRATYYLYKHLTEHSLPIGPLFTKAVVRISIIRPLSEHRFVSARRLIWVCKLVTHVEGEDVAKQIEATFWQWRGDLIRHAKDTYVAIGGDRQNKVYITTMKKLGLI
jgi:hypothetical protein